MVLILTNNVRACFLTNRLTRKGCSKLVPCLGKYYYAVYSLSIVIVISHCLCISLTANVIIALST